MKIEKTCPDENYVILTNQIENTIRHVSSWTYLLTIENCLSVNPTMISRGENINLELCGDDSAL